MDAPMNKNSFADGQSDPSVSFLYKTMLERDPKKRRVKPVHSSRVQVNFQGLEDSEEDSDFDISKLDGSPHEESDVLQDDDDEDVQTDEDESDEDEDTDDDDNDNEGEEEGMNKTKSVHIKDQGFNEEDAGNDDDSVDDEEDDPSDIEDDDDEENEESDEDDDDDDEEEEEDEVSDDDGDEDLADGKANVQSKSPEIKGLEHVWSMIDSDEDDEDYVPKKRKKKSAKGGGKSQPEMKPGIAKKAKSTPKSTTAAQEDGDSLQETAPQGRIKVIVCCVCLSDRSADDDEIVECDNCGISVHEGCYGISESHSTASTESSASTEPWFCDACKANAKPVCELCPNTGGIFKETDNGKWVHIVCALYTPGVAFGDVDKLSLVTLFEMPYSKWGARECSLCEDSRFSQTGVCINCDAGMCKAYFHVTCAQREGLLTEAAPEEVMDIADPFFAYCKLHADKITSKIKRRNWLAIQSHVKTHTPNLIEDEKERLRFNRKLNRHREKYSAAKLKRPPSWVPTQKMVRHLHTSPSAVRGFLRKAELMGVITQAQTVPVEKQEIRKKTQGQPAFTAEFINYFMDRNIKVDNLKINLIDLNSQNSKLQAQERVVRKQYDKLHAEVSELKQKGSAIRREVESLWGMLQDIHGKPVPHMPEVFKTRKRTRSPSKKDAPTSPTALINQCGVCHNTTEQHLLAKCDSCKKHYHLGCLDPPLTRMPKKTKQFGWQCSYCVVSSSDDSMTVAPSVVDGPRKLRETIKEPDKFFHLSHIQDSLKSQQKKSLMNKKNKQRREAARAKRIGASLRHSPKSSAKSHAPDTKKKQTPPKPKSSLSVKKRPSSEASYQQHSSSSAATSTATQEEVIRVLDIMCVVCNKDGYPSDTVRCDECMLSYHLRCLDPPMKKSPKVRGYAWHCEACDMLDSSDDDMRSARGRKEDRHQIMKRPTGREASNSILFDIDVSSEDSD